MSPRLCVFSLLASFAVAGSAMASTVPTNSGEILVSAIVESRCLVGTAPLDPARATPAAALRAVSLSCTGARPTVSAVAGLDRTVAELSPGRDAPEGPVAVIITY